MGAVGMQAKENDLMARMQTGENQKVPAAKARVQYLLDEIALLQVRFDNNHNRKVSKVGSTILPVGLKAQGTPALEIFGENTRSRSPSVDVTPSGETDHEEQKFIIDDQSSSQAVKELHAEDELSCTNMEAVSREDFFQCTEKRIRMLIEESAGFYENAEKELSLGKVGRLELTKLLQREKYKLKKHKSELEDLRTKVKQGRHGNARPTRLFDVVQDIIKKLVKFLDERESLHQKFEVQVEHGHYFKLLKLLELQKTSDDVSRRSIERNVQELRFEALEQARQDVHDGFETSSSSFNSSASNVDVKRDSGGVSEDESESVKVVPQEENVMVVVKEDVQLDGEQVDGDSHKHKNAKREVLKLMSEQEEKWKAQLEVLGDMERRLALSEIENQRLSNILKDRQRDECRGEVESIGCAGNLPQGYSSIYFSPIFQERKQTQHDKKDVEIQRLKNEISSLKLGLTLDVSIQDGVASRESESKFLDRVEVPTEEKTISIDACSTREELSSISSLLGLDLLALGDDTSEDEKRSVTNALRKLFLIFQQHRNEVVVLGGSGKPRVEAYVESLRSLSLHIRQLSDNLEPGTGQEDTDSKRIAELEAQVERMKDDMVRVAEEHARELDRKEKTLGYAQDLNLLLSTDMSKTENALADARMELTGLKVTSEATLADFKNEAIQLARGSRQDILGLEVKLKENDHIIQDLTHRVQACQRETDAVVQEKNDVLKRLQHVSHELQNCRKEVSGLEDEVAQRNQDGQLEELQTAREELQTLNRAHQDLEKRYGLLQSKLLETEYELSHREAALERLTLHLAASTALESSRELSRTESLRSKHEKKEHARKSIQEVEEKMASMAEEMLRAKQDMEEMKSQGFQLLHRLGRKKNKSP